MSTSDLDKLIRESEEAIQRLDDIQKRKASTPIWQRITRHFHKNSPHLINVMLAGTVFAVALGRLAQKQEHQAAKEEWEQLQRKLLAEKQAAEQQAHTLRSSTEALVQRLEAAASQGSSRDLPRLVQQQLAAWRQQVSLQPAAAEAAAAPPLGTDGASSASSSGAGKIMF